MFSGKLNTKLLCLMTLDDGTRNVLGICYPWRVSRQNGQPVGNQRNWIRCWRSISIYVTPGGIQRRMWPQQVATPYIPHVRQHLLRRASCSGVRDETMKLHLWFSQTESKIKAQPPGSQWTWREVSIRCALHGTKAAGIWKTPPLAKDWLWGSLQRLNGHREQLAS